MAAIEVQVDLEHVSTVKRKVTCRENVQMKLNLEWVVEAKAIVVVAHELASNVEKRVISLSNAHPLVMMQVGAEEDLEPALNVEKKVIYHVNALQVEVLAEDLEPVLNVVKKVIYLENVLQLVIVVQ